MTKLQAGHPRNHSSIRANGHQIFSSTKPQAWRRDPPNLQFSA